MVEETLLRCLPRSWCLAQALLVANLACVVGQFATPAMLSAAILFAAFVFAGEVACTLRCLGMVSMAPSGSSFLF